MKYFINSESKACTVVAVGSYIRLLPDKKKVSAECIFFFLGNRRSFTSVPFSQSSSLIYSVFCNECMHRQWTLKLIFVDCLPPRPPSQQNIISSWGLLRSAHAIPWFGFAEASLDWAYMGRPIYYAVRSYARSLHSFICFSIVWIRS